MQLRAFTDKEEQTMREPQNFEKNIRNASESKSMILPNGDIVSMDGYSTRLNNNVIAMGTSGASKTRSVVTPNLLAGVGSYIISDPKGNLHSKYRRYLEERGYEVIRLDFIHPEKSDGYNPFSYINTPSEMMKLSHYLTYGGKKTDSRADPYWDNNAEILLSAIIGYMVESGMPDCEKNISAITGLLSMINAQKIEDGENCKFDNKINELRNDEKEPWCYMQYQKIKQAPAKTLDCILTTVYANLGSLDTPEINEMMLKETIDFSMIGREKTAVFVEVSDTDRSRDTLVNTFYTQAMNALCTFADEECPDSRLPVPVRFMLDDFGTNCRIDGFENMISNIRSRNISAMIVLQSESQLENGYGFSAHTIMDNCDTFIYMGGNDVETALTISRRANKSLTQILDMPVGTNWVFRRGDKPRFSRTIDLDEYTEMPCETVRTRKYKDSFWNTDDMKIIQEF
ncbi:MAG: VirD4-like conjugal transfer protein, CD1115 family [Porcipelethomonas sp.]